MQFCFFLCRMRNLVNLLLLFTLFLSARALLIRENVVFRKINEISPTRSTWSIAIVTVFDTYDELIQSVYDRINASQAVITALGKHYRAESPNDRFYNLFNSLKIETDNILLIQQSLQKQMLGYRSISSARSKRSLIPFVGSALSFLFGTVSEGDLNTIRTHLRRLNYNQQKLTHVLKGSLTIIKQDHELISKNRQAINHILGQLKEFIKKIRQHYRGFRIHARRNKSIYICLLSGQSGYNRHKIGHGRFERWVEFIVVKAKFLIFG